MRLKVARAGQNQILELDEGASLGDLLILIRKLFYIPLPGKLLKLQSGHPLKDVTGTVKSSLTAVGVCSGDKIQVFDAETPDGDLYGELELEKLATVFSAAGGDPDEQEDDVEGGDDEDDVDEISDDESIDYNISGSDTSPRTPYVPYKCTAYPEGLIGLIRSDAAKVASRYGISEDVAEALLRQDVIKWNYPKLFDKITDTNPELMTNFLKTMGLSNVDGNLEYQQRLSQDFVMGKKSGDDFCNICADDFTAENPPWGLQCGCITCSSCQFMNLKSSNIEQGVHNIKCILCGLKQTGSVATNKAIAKIASFGVTTQIATVKECEELLTTRNKFLLNSYVLSFPKVPNPNPNLPPRPYFIPCPRPNCVFYTYDCVDLRTHHVVTCQCEFRFCVLCESNRDHTPCSCDVLKEWETRLGSGTDSDCWIRVNTRPCPNCKASISKDGGCLHMKCRACHFDFCWDCMGEWKAHDSYYVCKVPVSETRKKDHAKLKLEERMLSRFQKYSDLYCTFDKKERNAENELRNFAISTPTRYQMPNSGLSLSDERLLFGYNTILDGYKVLKHTYVCSFYMEDGGTQRGLFELQQDDLKQYLDTINGHLEAVSKSSNEEEAANHLAEIERLTNLVAKNYLPRISGSFEEISMASHEAQQKMNSAQRLRQYQEIPRTHWDCQACTYHNPMSVRTCEMCATSKPQ